MDGLEITEVVVFKVQTEAEVQPSISTVDDLEVAELRKEERGWEKRVGELGVDECAWGCDVRCSFVFVNMHGYGMRGDTPTHILYTQR